LRDSVELEWAGIPSVAVVHQSMEGTARAMARVSGMPDYGFVTVDYPHIPLAVWTAEEIDDVARQLAPKLIARLTAGPDA
jgi:hypothetical protein